jgi:hypothetical protein
LFKALLLGGDGSRFKSFECDIEVRQQSESFTKVAHFFMRTLKENNTNTISTTRVWIW